MDPSVWVTLVNESGLPLAMLFLSLGVNAFMFRIIQKLWEGRLADARQYIDASHEQTQALKSVTKVFETLTAEMRGYGRRNG